MAGSRLWLSDAVQEPALYRRGCQEPVTTYSCVGIDAGLLRHPDLLKNDVEKNGISQDYRIRLRFTPRMEFQEYSRLRESNDKIEVTKSTVIPSREFYEDYAMKSFAPAYRELPEYYDEHSSIYLETTVFPWDCLYPDEVAIECENVRKELDSLFKRYSDSADHRVLHRWLFAKAA